MKKRIRAGTITNSMYLVIVLAIVSVPVFANYEEQIREGIFLVRPENEYLAERSTPTYLSTEDLNFFACIEHDDTPVRLSILCEDNYNFVDISATAWGTENCYIGSLDLEDFSCHNALLAADYVHDGENLRLTKKIKINTITDSLERILNSQYRDGGWSSPLDTAFALYSLKPFEDVFNDSVQNGLQYLKDTRDDTDKCWPSGECQVSTTALIAFLLTQAEYDDTLRIVHDSTVYLEKTMSYIESDETWDVQLMDFEANENNSVNTSCVFAFGSDNTTYELDKYPEAQNVTITPEYDVTLNIVCTENIEVEVYSSVRGHFLHYEGDNMTYTVPGPCWTYNNENVTCDLRATAFAAGTPLTDDRLSAAQDYLASQLESSVVGTTTPDEDLLNMAAVLVSADDSITDDQREDMVRNILYRQANDGYWNTSDNYYNYSFYEAQADEAANLSHLLNDSITNALVYSGFIVQALLREGYERGDEVIEDAEWWASLNEDEVTATLDDESATDEDIVASYEENVTEILNGTKRNSMALYILQQNTRPIIKSSERIIILDTENITIDLVNPTTFTLEDLTYELPDELANVISVEEKEYLAPYSFRRITITQTNPDADDAFGYLRIISDNNEYAKIPVILERYPVLNITIPTSLTVFGQSTVVPLPLTKSSHTFSCRLTWKDAGVTSLSSFEIEDITQFNLPLQFSQPATEEKDYSGTLTCTAKTSTFTFPFTFRVNRFITKPLAVSPGTLEATDGEQMLSFSLKNLLDESIDITIGLANSSGSEYVDFSDYVLNLYPGEQRNISVFITTPTGENITEDTAVLIKTFNVEERIPLSINVVAKPEVVRPLWLVIAGSVFAVGLVSILSYFGYTNRKQLYTWYVKKFRKENEYQRIMKTVDDYERKGEAIAIKNMVQILKMEAVSDKDIRKRLQEVGYSDEEVTQALKLKTEEDAKPAAQNKPPQK